MHRGYKCEKEDCEFKSEKFSELVKHRREVHKGKPKSEQPVNCPYCEKVITTASGLRIHIDNIHEKCDWVKVFTCGECAKGRGL